MTKKILISLLAFFVLFQLKAQTPISVGAGSYASFVPLAESKSSAHDGCQAYQMEHRTIYAADSLLNRPLPSNDWWTYALVNPWTGKLWAYPSLVWADETGVSVAKPTYWEPTGCEMKWNDPVLLATQGIDGAPITFSEARLADWSDFMIRFYMEQGTAQVQVTVMHGSPIVWLEYTNCSPLITNPDASHFAIFQQTFNGRTVVAVCLLSEDLTVSDFAPYAYRIPRNTKFNYHYTQSAASLSTTFHIDFEDFQSTQAQGLLMGFLPHHYQNTSFDVQFSTANYMTPRGQMRLARGNDFTFNYTVHGMLPFFPLPEDSLQGYSRERMQALCQQYAAAGTFGADTYWGGKGLTQMMHYMTAALQLGDTATFRMAKSRLKQTLIDWYTYTPGEQQYYFAYYPRWGALVGFDPSYDSDTFNDHHFHYGYFVYASAVLCLLDNDFREQYGPMARELARDYANWLSSNPSALPEPWFRTLDPYCGHSFAGGMGNAGNGNGQESTSEAMQGWGGLWMLGAALGDDDMLQAGVFGYTLESRGTAEYWFDRGRRNIDYTKYNHPYCCNLTMQGVGWWTWFSGDPVWMHSIQWLPISPLLQNYLSEDRSFARWDYTQMYASKQVGDYEAASAGLGDESGLGNVCLSYLSLFDPDSAARVWDRMDQMGKPLAKNPDTGGITYLLAHSLRNYGPQCHSILADYPLAAAYVDTVSGDTTYAVYNASAQTQLVRFWQGNATYRLLQAPARQLTLWRNQQIISAVHPIQDDTTTVAQDSIGAHWMHAYPNVALHKPVTASSYENAGTLPVSATDGDITTRWGSQHQDNEQITIDLGAQYYINHITIRWEAAYASRYELAISSDNQHWSAVSYTGSGGVDTRSFAADLLAQGDSARGRYLRLVGLNRATQYGTSLYEFEAYGLPLCGDPSQVIALEVLSDQLSLIPGQTPQYSVHGYNYLGQELPIAPVVTQTSSTTTYTLTATCNGLQAHYSWPILEQIEVVSAAVSPKSVRLPLGDTQVFTISTLDQFGYVQQSEQRFYVTDQLGTYDVVYTLGGYSDTAHIEVVDYADLNLALDKKTTCSGSEGDATNAANAVDGLLSTRWSSRFRDGEWLQVDLGEVYNINRVKLYWEAAYATSYQILLSEDNVNWTTSYTVSGSTGGTQDIPLSVSPARYVKLLCQSRNTGYGASLWELEVYGTGRHPLPTQLNEKTVLPARKYIRQGNLYINSKRKEFNASGKIVK